MLLERIVGPEIRRAYIFTELEEDFSFTRQIVKSFLNTLVQTLYGSIRDLKEFVRVGRSLWPRYVQPLQSDNIEKTLLALQKRASSTTGIASSQPLDVPAAVGAKQILPFLDQQILPHIRANLTYGLYSLSEQEHQQVKPGGSLTATAYLVKCLMIAAFICQHNKADKDKQLFTIQKNGKRSHSNKKQQSHGEDLAFGNARNGVSKSFKLRLFPMERMLSVFVSIVGLNEDRMPGKAGQLLRVNELKPNKIGSSDLLDSLAHLRDMGMLHEKSSSSGGISTEEANLSAPKYWCSLTREEAEEVAKSVNFPLESYLY